MIQSLHFEGLTNLTHLLLSNNVINTIEEAAFEGNFINIILVKVYGLRNT